MGLIYDLMEPSRHLIEQAVSKALERTASNSEELTKSTLSILKQSLDTIVYVPTTRQHVRQKNLLHGNVLALRAYLIGDMKRFVIPCAGQRKGGRPPKISYTMPGNIPDYKG